MFLTLENTPLGYQLHCGNLMDGSSVEELGQRIGDLNNMSSRASKSLHRCLAKASSTTSAETQDLDCYIAKRTDGPIEFLVEPHPSELELVTLTMTIQA